jgi:hypothetical protein
VVCPHPSAADPPKIGPGRVQSPHTLRNYAKALDDLFQFCASQPLSRALLMEWKAGMASLSPSTINVRLSAVRRMVTEAKRNGMIGHEEAANVSDIPNIRRKGTRPGDRQKSIS